MASSNKNWPSMFRSKPCSNHHHHHHPTHCHNVQWQHHDIDTPSFMHYSSSPFASERAPDPKPRWNPRPEQIQILESIFNSGMINPPRDEIKNIRIRLQEYGQVGDANVFYWFQNRKSRTKHKLRHLQRNLKKSGSSNRNMSTNENNNVSTNPSFAGSVNQKPGLFTVQAENGFLTTEPTGLLFPVHMSGPSEAEMGFGYGDHQLSDVVVPTVTEQLHLFEDNAVEINGTGFSNVNGVNSKIEDKTLVKIPDPVPVSVPLLNQIQGESFGGGGCPKIGGDSPVRSTVFINDMPFDVAAGLFNVREAFGNDAVLIDSSGQPILTDEWGVTLHPLQNGAVYYLI